MDASCQLPETGPSSHPRLNRQKWGHQKRRRKRPFKLFGKTYREWCRYLKDWTMFYLTFLFVLLSIGSFFSTVFLVPFFIDPAWSTLQADFDPVAKTCVTVSGEFIAGRSNCSWSSCEEGCTKTIFTCWQVVVEYEVANKSNGIARLFPNIKGCGYPPTVNCSRFILLHGQPNTSFDCFISRVDSSLALVSLDLSDVKNDLLLSLVVPNTSLILSLIMLAIIYRCFYNKKKKKPFVPHSTALVLAASLESRVLKETNLEVENQKTQPDVKSTDEEDRQKKTLLALAKNKVTSGKERHPEAYMMAAALLAASGHKHKANCPLLVPGMMGGHNTSIDISKLAATRLRELQEAHLKKYGVANEQSESLELDPTQLFRQEYSAEKFKLMQYYHHYYHNNN